MEALVTERPRQADATLTFWVDRCRSIFDGLDTAVIRSALLALLGGALPPGTGGLESCGAAALQRRVSVLVQRFKGLKRSVVT